MTGPSTIHDLGYRRYTGVRRPLGGARGALYLHTLRTMFGLGRPLKAKAVPLLVLIASAVPALGMATASSLSQGQLPIRYGNYIGAQLLLFVLFLAAQVPEVVSRDQQQRLLPLLFTRDLTATSYALMRWLGVLSAVWLVAMAPLLVLWISELGVAPDPAAVFGSVGPRLGPILAYATMSASSLAGVAVACAVWTPRRAFATAAIFATFLLLAATAAGLDTLAGVDVRLAELLDPVRALRTAALLWFGETTRAMTQDPPASLAVYITLAAGHAVGGLAVFVWRIRRVAP